MRKILFYFCVFFFIISCNSQEIKIKDFSKNQELNYFFARIDSKKTITRELYKGSLYLTIYNLSDSKATPDNFSEGSEELLSSYIVSISPDGDYYTNSKLYKIEGLYMPNIIEIKETNYPEFSVMIEHGIYNKRRTDVFKLKGVN